MILKNKNILIFGGNSFLWNEMFNIFKESYANIYWINTAEEFENSNFECTKILFDSIYTIENYEKYFNDVIHLFPSLDGIVFSLSQGSLRPLNMTRHFHLSYHFELNCLSFVELIRIFQKKKKINAGASILAFSSISSLLGLKTKLTYAVSKAALNSAILNLASELSSNKIRVNGILKGALTTDLNHQHVKDMFAVGGDLSQSMNLGVSTPIDLANLSIFLLSDQVKTMTGTLIKLDSGYSLGR